MNYSTPRVIRVSLSLLMVAVITFGLHSLRTGASTQNDFPCTLDSPSEVSIEIPSGASGSAIAKILFDAGVVKSSASFFKMAVSKAEATGISPGSHRIEIQICAEDALKQLLDTTRIENLIKISEGEWNSEIVKKMIAAGFSQPELISALKDVTLPAGITSPEGVLFPAQYSFGKGTTALEAIQNMVDRFSQESTLIGFNNGYEKYSQKDLLTIASIIQAEGNTKDFTKIARTIYNRLRIDMPLQLDSTVHYITGVRGSIFLSTKATTIKSPYNTYKRYGLPPAPIGNPGVAALRAAISPEQGDWIYFITVAPGDTRFTASSDQFLKWKVEYIRNRRAGAFK
ncbi:unannotated protein [freshwater metagenome]|uniref:Unannotated protein n=1 Tax=freshwater metagenome TaxID=449393 RepID=A0A6J7XQM9_9ZZZZ|nr:endolytic transglycosylase MltG [Actinomycetota bacterium]